MTISKFFVPSAMTHRSPGLRAMMAVIVS